MLRGEPLQSSLLATPASHHRVVVNGSIFCRQTHPSDWHRILQNQNVCKSSEGFCRFPLEWEIQERQKNTIKDSAQAEGFSTPCWAALSSLHDCAVSWEMHETRQKTNILLKQIAPQHLLLLMREWKEPPACEQVLVVILTERITTHTPSSSQGTKAKWNMRWEGFKTSAEKQGNEQTLPAQCFVYFKSNQTTEIKLFVQISMVQFVNNWLMNLW